MIWPFIFLSYASLFVFGLTDNVRGPLFPEILKQFMISDAMGSMMWALSNISGLVASYACRHLLRKHDRLIVLQGGTIGLTISLWGLALATHYSIFLFFSFFFGLSLGVIGLIPNILVPMGSSSHRKQQMLSGLHTMYGLASFLAPLLAAAVAHFAGSWRWTFAVASLAPLALLLYSFHSSHQALHTKASYSPETHIENKKRNLKPQLFLALMLSFAVAAEIMISSRLALYMQRTLHFDMESSSLYVSYFFICMILGRFLFTVVHFKKSPQFLLAHSLLGTFIMALCGLFIHPLFLAGTGFTIAPFYPLTITWISSEFPEDLDTAVSYLMTTDSLMLICMHLGIGKLTDLFDIKKALLIGLVFLVLSFILLTSYQSLFKQKSPHT